MGNSENEFLSDVHVKKVIHEAGALQLTRFPFNYPFKTTEDPVIDGGLNSGEDEDDDLDISRADGTPPEFDDALTIYHTMSTKLPDVGLQVWRGALVMCDFVLANRCLFEGSHVLELGSGTGVTGIALSMQYCKRVTCSDTGSDVLSLCQKNLHTNERLLNCPVDVVDLDWIKIDKDSILSLFPTLPTIFVACDCVYDNELTDALFRTIFLLVKESCSQHSIAGDPIVAYMSLEKRINFSLHDKCVVSHEYDHFRTCLQEMCTMASAENYLFQASEIDITDIPSFFSYERVKQLEIWKIVARKT